MGVSIFLPSLRGGGAQRVGLDLANGFVSRGYKTDLILAKNEGVYFNLLKEKVTLHTFNKKNVSRSFFDLVTYFKEHNPQYFISIQRNATLISLLAAKYSGWKGFFIARETNSFDKVPGRNESWRDLVILFLIKRIYRYVDCVVAPSIGIARDLDYLSNVQIVPNPVCIPPPGKSLQRSKPYVLAVGSLDNQKRFDDLIKAYANFIKFNDDYELIILGEGKEREKLMKLAANLGVESSIELPGFVDDPFMYMREAAVFVLSSAWEGLPNVLLQAMACGAPVVATDCKHGPREILAGGKYGELVPVGDIDAMAAAMSRQVRRGRVAYPPEALAPYDYEAVLDSYQKILINSVSQ